MNDSHRINKKYNRMRRCKKRLSDKYLTEKQRNNIIQRQADLELELKNLKK